MIHRYTQREALDGENLGYKGTSTERKVKRGEEIFKVFLSHRIDIFEMYVEKMKEYYLLYLVTFHSEGIVLSQISKIPLSNKYIYIYVYKRVYIFIITIFSTIFNKLKIREIEKNIRRKNLNLQTIRASIENHWFQRWRTVAQRESSE